MRAHRERKAASLLPLAPVEPLPELSPALEVTLSALKLGDDGAALAALARLTARLIDQAQNPALALVRLGGLMLRILQLLDVRRPGAAVPRQGPGKVAAMRAQHVQTFGRR